MAGMERWLNIVVEVCMGLVTLSQRWFDEYATGYQQG
jgi:hypothetical protein